MKSLNFHSRRRVRPERGFTLLELIIAATILSILTMMALPLARITIQREREKELRQALWEMRDAHRPLQRRRRPPGLPDQSR